MGFSVQTQTLRAAFGCWAYLKFLPQAGQILNVEIVSPSHAQ
jgi:hypothetical protein